jgi:hypothetical protein
MVMKQNRYFFGWIVLCLVYVHSCKQRETFPVESSDLSIYPAKARIGDTITIKGILVDKTLSLSVNQGPFFGANNDFKILKKSQTEMTAVLPEVSTEKILITLHDIADLPIPNRLPALDSIKYDIVGIIPINPKGIAYSDEIHDIQCVDEKLHFAAGRKKVFKSTDGGYSWHVIKTHNGLISDVFFLNKDQGWNSVVTYNSAGSPGEVFYTNDSGLSYQRLNIPDLGDDYIIDMFFANANEGYLLSGKGSIWRTSNNNTFDLIYSFSDRDPDNPKHFLKLFVDGDNILAYGRGDGFTSQDVIIRGKSNTFTYKLYDQKITKLQKTIGASAFAIFNRRLHLSQNDGESWEKVSDMDLTNIHFFDSRYGIGLTRENVYGSEVIVETRDGGVTWTRNRKLENAVTAMDFSDKSGIIAGTMGRLWKYILY